jgi:hypothetical protein
MSLDVSGKLGEAHFEALKKAALRLLFSFGGQRA